MLCLALWPSPDGSFRGDCESSMVQQSLSQLQLQTGSGKRITHYRLCVLFLQRAVKHLCFKKMTACSLGTTQLLLQSFSGPPPLKLMGPFTNSGLRKSSWSPCSNPCTHSEPGLACALIFSLCFVSSTIPLPLSIATLN